MTDSDQERYIAAMDSQWFRAIVELQDVLLGASVQFWSERKVKALQLPLTTGSISSPMGLGSDSHPVSVDLFGVTTYLADSMQFMLEYGCRLSPAGCWYLMPSFRGEAADSSHLCQFFHSEAEIPGDLDAGIEAAEAYLRSVSAQVLERADEVRVARPDLTHVEAVVDTPVFERLTFDEAAARLKDVPRAVEHGPGGWRTLTRAGEERLIAQVGGPVWVSHWDHLAVPFYQGFDSDERTTARNADLLLGLGELVGLGERHPDGESVRRALDLHQVHEDSYAWYLKMKDHRPMQTTGFGMGTERFFAWLMGHHDVRDFELLQRRNGEDLLP